MYGTAVKILHDARAVPLIPRYFRFERLLSSAVTINLRPRPFQRNNTRTCLTLQPLDVILLIFTRHVDLATPRVYLTFFLLSNPPPSYFCSLRAPVVWPLWWPLWRPLWRPQEEGDLATNVGSYGIAENVYPFGVDPAWHIAGNEVKP